MCVCVQGSTKDVFQFTTFCVQFASYVGLFVLTLLPEHHSRRHSYTLLHDGIDQVRETASTNPSTGCLGR